MKTTIERPVSTLRVRDDRASRVTKQTLQTLSFIHRFRHVNARHVQLLLGHTSITTTYNQLNLLCAKGYIGKITENSKRFLDRQATSYFLTPTGLELLKKNNPMRSYRRLRSVQADARMSQRPRERYLTLADVYADFKRHNNGHFEFFSDFDLLLLDYVPQPVPDGYIRTTIPGTDMQHFFIEIFGWGRPTGLQQRRLRAYIEFAESGIWNAITGLSDPNLLIVVPSEAVRLRLHHQFKQLSADVPMGSLKVFTAISNLLDGEISTIWRPLNSEVSSKQ